ncbi:UvrD-helicase domain-containing protein [Limisalsivibrio acetivorans]|uniref:UvrD-helicase domain-containing protein n=1 Tax=Limisalsivibrio acetivorans TaxID=1304888 RepID=UPI0003B622B1|nr:UvrD-helicase domain-containing protein [Limisalsivibrio acetivorans]
MKALRTDKNIALVASAGTGKTYNLALRVINLLMNGARPHELLCITFTNKATNEMRERILRNIDDIINCSSVDMISEGKVLMELNSLDSEALKAKLSGVRDDVLENFSSLRIKTVDSFVNLILTLFPFEADIRPGYTVTTDQELDELREEAFFETFQVFREENRNVLESASVGLDMNVSSFPETLHTLVKKLESSSTSSRALLAKYYAEPGELAAICENAGHVAGTAVEHVKSFGTIMKKETLNKNQQKQIDKFCRLYSINEVVKIQFFLNGDIQSGYYKKFVFDDAHMYMYDSIHSSITRFLELRNEIMTKLAVNFFGKYKERLESKKKEANTLSFTDITDKAYELLVEGSLGGDKDYLYFRLDGRIRHILIDEFQDTSLAQWKILEPLASEAMAGIGQKDESGSFFFVGDPKQTLYRFRGGEPGLFDRITDSFPDKIERQELDVNYRSSRAVMTAVNELFSSINDFSYTIQSSHRENEGYVEITERDKDSDITEYCIDKCHELIEAGYSHGDIAILVGDNKKAATITNELKQAGIQARSESSATLDKSPVSLVLRAALSYLSKRDPFSLYEYLMLPPAECMSDQVSNPAYVKNTVSMFDSLSEELETKAGLSVITCIVEALNLADRFDNDPNLLKIIDIAASLEPYRNLDIIAERLEKLCAVEKLVSSSQNEAVTLMTIHKSKGLQFPVVLLPELNIGMRPDSRKSKLFFGSDDGTSVPDKVFIMQSREHNELMGNDYLEAFGHEEKGYYRDKLNQLYVAMTRAEDELYISLSEGDKKDNLESIIKEKLGGDYICGVKGAPDKSRMAVKPSSKTVEQPIPLAEPEEEVTESIDDLHGETFGNALHEALQKMTTFTPDEIDEIKDFILRRFYPVLKAEDTARIADYLDIIINDHLFTLLINSSEIFQERGFMHGGKYRVIDFYAVKDDRIICIDFKTGEIDEQKLQLYSEQLKEYAVILGDVYNLPVETSIASFSGGEINWIEV